MTAESLITPISACFLLLFVISALILHYFLLALRVICEVVRTDFKG